MNIKAVKGKLQKPDTHSVIVRKIVVLLSSPASQSQYRKSPLVKKKVLGHTNHLLHTQCMASCCAAFDLGSDSLKPSAGNLYLSYRWSSGKVSGSNRSLKTLSRHHVLNNNALKKI